MSINDVLKPGAASSAESTDELDLGVPVSLTKCGFDQKVYDGFMKEVAKQPEWLKPGFGPEDQVDAAAYAGMNIHSSQLLQTWSNVPNKWVRSNQKLRSMTQEELQSITNLVLGDSNESIKGNIQEPKKPSGIDYVRSEVLEKLYEMLGKFTMATVISRLNELEKPYVEKIKLYEQLLADKDSALAAATAELVTLRMNARTGVQSVELDTGKKAECSNCGKEERDGVGLIFLSSGKCVCTLCKYEIQEKNKLRIILEEQENLRNGLYS